MSWLGVNLNDSLQNIKGQITSFTRDVLAEDTLEDNGCEILVPKRRLKEMEAEIFIKREEVEQLKAKNVEAEDRLRALDFSHSQRNSSLQKQLFDTQEELRQLTARSQEWGWDGTTEPIEGMSDVPLSPQYVDRVSRLESQLLEERERHKEDIVAIQDSHQADLERIKEKFDANGTEKNRQEPFRHAQPQHSQVVVLESELTSLKAKYEALSEEKKQLSSNLEELDTQNQIAIEQVLKSKHELSEELKLLRESFKKSEGDVLRLNDLLASSQSKIDPKYQNEKEHQVLLQSLNEKIKYLTEENLTLTTQIDNSKTVGKNELKNSRSKLEELQVSRNQLDSQLKQQLEQISTLECELNKGKDKVEKEKKGKDKLIEKLKVLEQRSSLIPSLENEVSQLKGNLEEALNEQLALKHKISEKENELRKHSNLINEMEDNATSQEEQILKFEAVLEEKNHEHINAFARLKLQENMTRSVIQDFESEKKILQSKVNELEEKNRQLTCNSNCEVLSEYEEIIQQLLSKCNIQNFKDLPTAFSDLSSEVASLRCERDRLSDDLSSTIQELRDSQDLNEALEVEKAETERECEDLRDQLEELQCGERQNPEGSLTPRSLPTIEEEELETNVIQQEAISKEAAAVAKEEGANEEGADVEGKYELMERIHQLHSQVTALSEARHNLEMELASAKEEKCNLEQRFLELSGQLGNLSNLEVEAVTLRNKNRTLIGQLNESKNYLKSCSHVEEEKNNLALQIHQMTTAMDKMNFDSSHMRLKEEEYLKEKHILQGQLTSQNRTIHEYFHEIARLQTLLNENNNASNMQTELDKVKGLLIYKDDQIDHLKQGIEQIGEIFDLKQVDLRHVFVHIKQEYFSLKNKLKQTEIELEKLQELYCNNSKTDDVASFESSCEPTAKEDLPENDSKFQTVQCQLTEAQNQIKELKDINTLLVEENKNMKKIELKYENVLNEKKKVQLELEKEMQEKKTVFDEKQQMFDHINQSASEIENLKKSIEELSKNHELHMLQKQSEKLSIEETLKSEIQLLQSDLSNKLTNIQCLKGEIESLKVSTSCEPSCQHETKENAIEQETIDKYEHDMQNQLKENQNQFMEMEKLRNEIEELKLSNLKLKNENDSLKHQISEFQCERHQMITTSTQKHQESIAYYNEIQRLTNLIQQENMHSHSEIDSLKMDLAKKEAALQESLEQCQSLDHRLKEHQQELSKAEEILRKNSVKSNEQLQLQEELKVFQREMKTLQEENSKNQELLRSVLKERDHLRMANSSFNSQYEEKSKELASLQEKEKHLFQENQRLKQHLVEVEETYTKEVVQSEQREASLRQSLAKVHEKMANHSTHYSNTNQKTAAQLGSIQEQLSDAIHQRDEALHQLQTAEEASLQHQEALIRLQQVLQDFQKGQMRDISVATEREKRKFQEEKEKNRELEMELKKLKVKISDMEMGFSATKTMREDLQAKEDTVIALKSQVHSMQLAAKKSQEQVALLQSSSDCKVDKHVLRNLIVGYFATPSDKQREVLRIIAEVLDFSSEERTRSGIDMHPGSWLASIANFLAPPPSNIRIASKVDVLDHSSLSQAFIRFLEEESTPRLKPKLPAVQMAEEANQKAQKKAQTKVGAKVNPFLNSSDAVTSTGPGSSLFAASDLPSLPTLQPVSVSSTQDSRETFFAPSTTLPSFMVSASSNESTPMTYPAISNSPTFSSEQISTSKFLNNLLNADGMKPGNGHS